MIISYKLFWKKLHENNQNVNIQNVYKGGKGFLTVSSMHRILCDEIGSVSQKHLAEYDVEMELDILYRVLKEFNDLDDLYDYIETKNEKGNLTKPYWDKKRKIKK